jgi:hypothetical protein
MKLEDMTTIVGLVLVAGFVALTLSLSAGATSVWAASPKNGQLHVTKECSQYSQAPGGYCTFTSSNLAEILVGSRIYYDQGPGVPSGFNLDSNVILDAGSGSWAVGRCTLDSTFNGVCTFSDGSGEFTGFEARVNVSPSGGPNFAWEGTYRFRPQPPR